jgi:hypothetical protein
LSFFFFSLKDTRRLVSPPLAQVRF